ncbi:MAG: tetraacyldisaccharide 4'-kinase [Paramuribaculum sp.]|nr:tetraacyldisaccharide 4'-kinase [Paramuribaculum sp.]
MARRKTFLSVLLLYPISKIYGMVIGIRNMMFNHGMLRQHSFDIPIITVGNISVGGTGKTPHTEYIVEALCNKYKLGVLSRGYKRKTKGFVLATPQCKVEDIGDESYQIFRKFEDKGVVVAVCENRVKGIEQMRELYPELNLIVLDDAFQHRYVKPSISVVLIEANNPAYEDSLLPYGRLREPIRALDRADVVIVTKCPEDIKPMECRLYKTHLNLFPYQKLLFSRYKYQELKPLFPGQTAIDNFSLTSLTSSDTILAVSGVANPRPFIRYLRTYKAKVKLKRYADHHRFTRYDLDSILQKFKTMGGKRKVMITTEKDAVRLISNPYFPTQLRDCSYYLPIKVSFEDLNDESLSQVLDNLLRSSGGIHS